MTAQSADERTRQRQREILIAIVCIVLAGAILVADLYVPLGVAIGVAYVVVILLALQVGERIGWIAAIATTLLTWIGFLNSESGGIPWMVLVNRALAVLVIWSTTIVGVLRIRAKNVALRSQSNLKAVIQTAADGIATIDANGTLLSFNTACENLFGYSAIEVLGKNVSMLMPSPYRESHDGYLENYQRTGIPKVIGSIREVEGLRKDGSTFPVELSVGDATVPVGSPTYVGLIRDVTEKKEHEAILRQMAAIVTSSNDAIISQTPKGRVLSWNEAAERMYGYSASESIGEHINFIVPDDRREELDVILRRAALGENVKHFDTVRKTRSGELLDVSLTVFPIVGENGEITAIAAIGRDITELKQAAREIQRRQELLEAVNQELEGFSYSVSHDLRAPLRAIDGFAKAFGEDYGDKVDDEGRRLLRIITDNTQKMGQLIDDLLAFSRLSRRRAQAHCVDMTSLARAAFDEARLHEPDREIDFRLETLPLVAGDPTMLRQVWVNLIGNAVKYTRPRAKAIIDVDGCIESGEARFTIQDNGVGFDDEYAHKLFGVFQRLHSDKEFEGTGVGLALVHRIIKRHDGRIWGKGAPGQGATFQFTLPVWEETDG